MIKESLVFTKNTLDEYLKNRFKLDEETTVLNYLVDQDGLLPLENQNKVVMSLINLEEETNRPYPGRYQMFGDDGFQQINPSIRFNMDVLFTACFKDYEESLKFLNATISYFQGNNPLTVTNNPDMPNGLGRLTFDVESITYSETHNLWTAMGAKYQPSVIYKVRLITVQAEVTQETGSVINGISTPVRE